MSSTRRLLVVGNWKMHGSIAFTRDLAGAVAAAAPSTADVVVCPPHVLLTTAAAALSGSRVGLGAQTVSEFEQGAYTGETSPSMLIEVGCRWVIVGHSERRQYYGETNEVVAAKSAAALKAGLIPIICVGESLAERQNDTTEKVIEAQLQAVADDVIGQSVIAYEPIWAIGTGETATPEQAQAVHAFIRSSIDAAGAAERVRILYGGSVKPDNAAQLFQMPDVDGGLIGGAALKADDFLQICRAA